MEETYVPVLVRWKARKDNTREQNSSAVSSKVSLRVLLWRSLSRPPKILCFCPDVVCLSLYSTFVYGVYYIFLTTMSNTFETVYGFHGGTVGLAYIGLGIGACSGSLVFGNMSDVIARKLAKGGERKPEHRLPAIIPGSLFTPVGLLWFGWTVQHRVHYIVPIVGTAFVGVGVAACFVSGRPEQSGGD